MLSSLPQTTTWVLGDSNLSRANPDESHHAWEALAHSTAYFSFAGITWKALTRTLADTVPTTTLPDLTHIILYLGFNDLATGRGEKREKTSSLPFLDEEIGRAHV